METPERTIIFYPDYAAMKHPGSAGFCVNAKLGDSDAALKQRATTN